MLHTHTAMANVCVTRGSGARNKLEYRPFSTSEQAWHAVTRVVQDARGTRAPRAELWAALDAKLPDKAALVKVTVQAQCLRLMRFDDNPAMDAWLRASVVVARGAHALFQDGTDDRWKRTYQPFDLVQTGTAQVRPEGRQHVWHAGVTALDVMVEHEAAFVSLAPETLAALYLLSYTADNVPHAVEAFDEDFWWLRVIHLSLTRNVDLRAGNFKPVAAKPRRDPATDPNGAIGELRNQRVLATRALSTAIALKVAIFYTCWQRAQGIQAPSAPGVSRHTLHEAKRQCLGKPRAPKPPREPAAGVTDFVRASMLDAALQQRVPVNDVLQRASDERGVLNARIRRLDIVACAHAAWRRALEADRATATSTLIHEGLPLCRSDSIWQDVEQPAVRKLVAIGAGADWQPRVVHAHPEAATARAARTEMASLVQRLLALLALEFRLRTTTETTHVALPLELQQHGDLPVKDVPPSGVVPAHVEAYARALRARAGRAGTEATFAAAVARAVARAIRRAFFGCLQIVSSTCTAVVDADVAEPRARAALHVIHCMLSIAARHHALVAHDCDEEDVVAIAIYHREAQTFAMPDLERVVAHDWPAARALATVAAACEPWVRDARKAPPPPHASATTASDWWVGIGASGLAVHHEAKAPTLARLDEDAPALERWWPTWPPTRNAVLEHEAHVRTAIVWGGKATAAFLGIAQPDQYAGRAPFK